MPRITHPRAQAAAAEAAITTFSGLHACTKGESNDED